MDALDPGILSPFTLKNAVFNGQLINIIRNRLSSRITNSSTIYHFLPSFFLFQFYDNSFALCHNLAQTNLLSLSGCLWHADPLHYAN